jgi:hypothetical protein
MGSVGRRSVRRKSAKRKAGATRAARSGAAWESGATSFTERIIGKRRSSRACRAVGLAEAGVQGEEPGARRGLHGFVLVLVVVLVLDKARVNSADFTNQGVCAKNKSSVIRKCSVKTRALEDDDEDEDEYESMARPSWLLLPAPK